MEGLIRDKRQDWQDAKKNFTEPVSLLKALQWRSFSFLNEPLTISQINT